METQTKWLLGGGAVLAAGAYYWFFMRPKTLVAQPGINAAVLTPPQIPTLTPAPAPSSIPRVNIADISLTRSVIAPVQQGVFVQGGGGGIPMPTGVRGPNGFFYTWSPLSAGKMIQDPSTGTWIANLSNQGMTVYTPMQAHPGAADSRPSTQAVVPPGYMYSLATGGIRA